MGGGYLVQEGTSSPLPEPPSFVRDVRGAFGASLRVLSRLLGSREDQLTHRAEPVITATRGSFLRRRLEPPAGGGAVEGGASVLAGLVGQPAERHAGADRVERSEIGRG